MKEFNIYRIMATYLDLGKKNRIIWECDNNFCSNNITLPILPSDAEITFFYQSDGVDSDATVRYELLEKSIVDGTSMFTIDELGELGILNDNNFCPHIVFDKKAEAAPVEMDFADITETDLFDFPSITKGNIDDESNGVWAYHGLRKFEFTFENLPYNRGQTEIKAPRVSITFTKKDNDKIEEPIVVTDITVATKTEEYRLTAYIDTNRIGDEFTTSKQFIRFFGALELTFEQDTEPKVTYIFPIEMLVHNTNYYKDEKIGCKRLSSKSASIDFGTSSTCVAIERNGRYELLTLSSENIANSERNIFENPTNLMIYNWESIYKQWASDNDCFPHLLKGTYDNHIDRDKPVEFDVGYTVNDVLEQAESHVLRSILMQIKLIAYNLEAGLDLEVEPLVKPENGKSVIKLVASPEEQNDAALDPIAFYGYLIGRAINDPSKGEIYTKFNITYPVKFNKEICNKLKHSLEYGLMRSIPLPLRTALDKRDNPLFKVAMNYSEPECYVGAICGKYLKAEHNKPGLFAVYDFGGGTLDSSFGMFSLDEDEQGVIDIFGVDGDAKIGGESIISQISYWIYSSYANIGTMLNNRIPFVMPDAEQIPNDFPERLLNTSITAKTNLRKVDEMFSRKLFKATEVPEAAVERIELLDENNDPVDVELSIDYMLLNDMLADIIEKTITNFKRSLNSNFERQRAKMDEHGVAFDISKVHIYKSGNASRNKLVEFKMEEHFPQNNIMLVDEAADGTQNKKYAITPKTAIAFGHLQLSSFTVNRPTEDAPFGWNIYSENKGNATFKEVLLKNVDHKNWVKFGPVKGSEVELFCSDAMITDRQDRFITVQIELDEDYTKGYLYLRVHDEKSVEYCVCEKGVEPDDNAEIVSDNVKKIGTHG